MVICISGDYRSGKSGFSSVLSKELGLPHYSMRQYRKEKSDDYNTNFINWEKNLTFKDNYDIDRYILDMAKKGDCVLDFRYAAILCCLNHVDYIGIWISADIETRLYGNSFCWNKEKNEVARIIHEREEKEYCTAQTLYGVDYRDKEYYDYLIDLTDYWYPIEEVSVHGMNFYAEIQKIKNKIFNNQDDYNTKENYI